MTILLLLLYTLDRLVYLYCVIIVEHHMYLIVCISCIDTLIVAD